MQGGNTIFCTDLDYGSERPQNSSKCYKSWPIDTPGLNSLAQGEKRDKSIKEDPNKRSTNGQDG
jgi:hypothetical protein